ncbi:MAG: circadian clock protein KaiC [Phycisphaerales bacterium]|nr:circadian clock protein KaiC [Phycisphaerales bacterium]
MGTIRKNIRASRTPLPKSPTGISGLDEITLGGLPRGRPTLVCGGAGCGKSLFGIEFLVRGATQFNENGVLMTFEEPVRDVTQNVTSLGFDLDSLVARKKLVIDHVRVERSEIEEAGDYDLEGLFIRLNYAIDSVGAKRVVLDTLESLFSGLANHAILRAELRRLFGWLKEKGVTAIITGERGEATLTRQGLEEYVSDCVISLDHRVIEQVSTRRLRVVKYRGSTHGTNEYPFLIDEDGISVLPVTSAGLEHQASSERVGTGVKDLDSMLGGKGYFRGSSILVSGTAGTGKSTLAAHFADAACRRGERCLYFAFEESPHQILRNMRSIGLDLGRHVASGKLRFHASRPTLYGLETHLATVHKKIADFQPRAVVVDPISNLATAGSLPEVRAMLLRLVDFLKMRQITALLTNLTSGGQTLEGTDVSVSSLVDTWLLLRDLEHNGERNRGIYVLKSRGMAHSNQVREFLITSRGIKLVDVYLGPAGMLTGSARVAQVAREAADELKGLKEVARRQRLLKQKRQAMEAQVLALRAAFEAEREEVLSEVAIDRLRREKAGGDRAEMARSRSAGTGTARGNENGHGMAAVRRDREILR